MFNTQKSDLFLKIAHREPVIFNPGYLTEKEVEKIREFLLMAGYIRIQTAKDGTQQWEAGE